MECTDGAHTRTYARTPCTRTRVCTHVRTRTSRTRTRACTHVRTRTRNNPLALLCIIVPIEIDVDVIRFGLQLHRDGPLLHA